MDQLLASHISSCHPVVRVRCVTLSLLSDIEVTAPRLNTTTLKLAMPWWDPWNTLRIPRHLHSIIAVWGSDGKCSFWVTVQKWSMSRSWGSLGRVLVIA